MHSIVLYILHTVRPLTSLSITGGGATGSSSSEVQLALSELVHLGPENSCRIERERDPHISVVCHGIIERVC